MNSPKNNSETIKPPQHESRESQRPRLTREEVLKLIERNGGPEGLNLSGYDLSGINLSKLDLHGVIFGNLDILGFSEVEVVTQSANLEGAWLERSNLQRANFGRANLRGAHFYHSDLTESTFWAANAEGADFRKANLSRADLYSTVLENCRFTDAQLAGVNLHLADLQDTTLSAESLGSRILQENASGYREYYERWYVSPIVREKYASRHLRVRYRESKEIYLSLKNAFLNSGRYDDASWAYFKERQMERKSYSPFCAREHHSDELSANSKFLSRQRWAFHIKYTLKWLASLASELLIGYGERPLRVVFWSLIIILVFPFLYWLSSGIANPSGHPIRWLDYLHYSLAAFSTIGFPDLVPMNDAAKLLTSVQALSGIAGLAMLMFTLGNRVSRS